MRLLLRLCPRRIRGGLVGAGGKLGLRPWPVSVAAKGRERYAACATRSRRLAGGGGLHNNQMVVGLERLGWRYMLAALRACSTPHSLLGHCPQRTRRGLVGAGGKLGLCPWPVSAAVAGRERYAACATRSRHLAGGGGSTQQSNGRGVREVGAANKFKNEDYRCAERRKKWLLVDRMKYGHWRRMHNDKESC
jgi:hypothetical protein